MPEFSVIIPSAGQRRDITRVLTALHEHAAPFIKEIIVVWDGAPNADVEKTFPACRFLTHSSDGTRGPSAARNLGAAHAYAEWLIFLDDDVVPRSDAFERIAQALARHGEVTAWAFSIVPHDEVTDNLYVEWAYRDMAHSAFKGPAAPVHPSHFCSSFIAIHQEEFRRVGGFDERLRFYEDSEWATRSVSTGGVVYACPDVTGLHLRQMDRAWFLERCRQFAPAIRQLHHVNPEAVSSRARFMLCHPGLAGMMGSGWPLSRGFLPVVERFPALLAHKMLYIMAFSGMAWAVYRTTRNT